LLEPRPRYGDFYIFQDGGDCHTGFPKFQFFNGQNGLEGETASLCQILSKLLQPWPRYRDFSIFQDGGHGHLGFLEFKFFNGRNSQKGQIASLCQISSKSLESRQRYVSFNIMLVWLENAYSHPFWGYFWGTFPPNDVTHRPNENDNPWA